MLKRVVLSMTLVGSCVFGAELHSKVKVSKKGDHFLFETIPNPGLVINFDKGVNPPWKVKVTHVKDVGFESETTRKFEKNISGMRLNFKTIGTKPSFDYSYTAFVCDSDLKNCYRDVHKGRYN